MNIASDDFVEIIKELERQPIEVTKYRLKSGVGRSQVFGVVNRRSVHPDYSRHCWKRPFYSSYFLTLPRSMLRYHGMRALLTKTTRQLPIKIKATLATAS